MFDPPLGREALERAAGFHRPHVEDRSIEWREALLDTHGHRMLCRFEAPCAAALRQALADQGTQIRALWAGTIRVASWPPQRWSAPPSTAEIPVLAECSFDGRGAVDDVHGLEAACAWCFEAHRVRLVRMLVSHDLDRVVYLCRAPDVESLRSALRYAGAGLDAVWAYRAVARMPALVAAVV